MNVQTHEELKAKIWEIANRLGEHLPATFSKGHATLIEAICRSVYMMTKLKRYEFLDEECSRELDGLVAAARKTMEEGSA